ncbi:MAG: GtrA family protein [Acidimicrobiales bacterium]|jgi:putative flippase GtrA|nr:GtrA family protein [Acidimicrobiales bacterium]|tara:strand:+ start:702 stop:1163 length:462 start_codon:yes stop_codon:yes gene_type:complete
MIPRIITLPARLWREYGQKLLRFAGVSVVNVLTGQTLLVVLYGRLGWSGMAANVVAVAVGSIPAYLLSRHYVWERNKGDHKMGEILPFWSLAFVGLVLSTALVGVVDSFSDRTIAVQAANAIAFGMLWLVRFAVLEHLLWGDRSDDELVGTSG